MDFETIAILSMSFIGFSTVCPINQGLPQSRCEREREAHLRDPHVINEIEILDVVGQSVRYN